MTITPDEVTGAVTTVTSIIGVAAVAAAALPQGKQGTLWANVRVILDAIAQNYANAANAKKK